MAHFLHIRNPQRLTVGLAIELQRKDVIRRTCTSEEGESICPNNTDISSVKFWMHAVLCFGPKPEWILSILLTRPCFADTDTSKMPKRQTFRHGVPVPPGGNSFHSSRLGRTCLAIIVNSPFPFKGQGGDFSATWCHCLRFPWDTVFTLFSKMGQIPTDLTLRVESEPRTWMLLTAGEGQVLKLANQQCRVTSSLYCKTLLRNIKRYN